ncbi:hypothetical protein Leryth_005205 [Lithospermum erythrorhizon]|nr:hypothetical protein Leryth_005205 [Lithospermum erythrorhizon]
MLQDCLINIVGVGLSCVSDSPDERTSMKDALNSLNNIKSAILKLMAKLKFLTSCELPTSSTDILRKGTFASDGTKASGVEKTAARFISPVG